MMFDQAGNGLKALVRRFARAERGNVAMMFAVILPVLITSVGAAVDYTRASKVRTSMQSAADATALMISKEAAGLTPSQVTTKAQAYFNALFNNPEVSGTTFSAVYTANTGSGASVKIDASGSMTADILKVTVPMSVSSTTKWGNIRYRIALALDNTGSMDSANKMTELKSAANKLIDDFYNMAGSDADIYLSIVPFARDVNVGNANRNETWVSWEYYGTCSSSTYKTKTACQNAGRTWTQSTSKSSWSGCVMDRDQNYDTTSDALAASPAGAMAPAHYTTDCPVSMIGMTGVRTGKTTLTSKISAMAPNGTTNQSIGMFWAWQTLKTSGPFAAPAKDSNYIYMDVVVLLTDGLNTENRWDSNCTYYGCSHEPAVDTRQQLLCTNMRTAGVKIFAIQVATDGDAVSTVTKNCTSEPNNSNYFSYITQASQMTVKFQNIFKELAKLRVAA
jgi:Flp pilus assembly protein TadG